MNRFIILLAILSTLLFSSCLDIIEEIRINKNEVHSYSLTFDMTKILTDPILKDAVLESFRSDSLMSLDKDGRLAVDSISYFNDDPKFKNSSLSKTIKESAKTHMVFNEKKEQMTIKVDFKFNDVSEIAIFFETLQNSGNMDKSISDPNLFIFGGNYKLGKKSLKRLPPKEVKIGDIEGVDMMRMLLSEANYTTNYYLPGKIKKTDFENSKVIDNKVTVTNYLFDILDNKVKMSGEIKFKK